MLELPRVQELARLWYSTRLDEAYRGRSPQEAQTIFRRVGLVGPFWEA